jgi:hypothetical protein
MNIGVIILSFIILVGGIHLWNVYSTQVKEPPKLPGLLVPQQVGKSKHIQSKTGDASMATEWVRRRAISGVSYCGNTLSLTKKAIRETRVSTGSTNGYLESYMISGLCAIKGLAVPVAVPFPEYDGGNAYDVGVVPFDSGDYNGGDAFTQPPNEYDGGDANTFEYGTLFDNALL